MMAVANRLSVPAFVGGSNRLVSPNVSVETSINLYQESRGGSSGGKVQKYLRGSEGLRRRLEVDDTNARCLFFQNERLFGVTGTTFWEGYDDWTTQVWGTVLNTGHPATIVSNGTAGNQLLIASGLQMYVFDLVTNLFQVMDIGENVEMVEFMDGYGFALIRATRQVRYSDLEDFLSWPALSVFERSWGSDNISFIKRAGRQLWIVGNQTSEVWADTGDPDIPFSPIQGVFLDTGCVAGFTGVRNGESLTWLTQDERGGGVLVRANGYTPEKISTYAIDLITLATAGAISGATSFVHQVQGHTFCWLQGVSETTTPVLDLEEGVWSERRMWNPDTASWDPHIASCHAYAFEKHLVGDGDFGDHEPTGFIYELSSEYLDDDV